MRNIKYYIVIGLAVFGLNAAKAGDEFPEIGKSYSLTYPNTRNGDYLPTVVKILQRSNDGWCLVEYQIAKARSVSAEKSEENKVSQAPEVLKRWINFNAVVSAFER